MDLAGHIINNKNSGNTVVNNHASETVSANLVTGDEINRENSKDAGKRSSTAGDPSAQRRTVFVNNTKQPSAQSRPLASILKSYRPSSTISHSVASKNGADRTANQPIQVIAGPLDERVQL